MTMKTLIWEINSYKDQLACERAVKQWRSDKGLTRVIVVPNRKVGYDASGTLFKASARGSLTLLRFTQGKDAVMFKLGYVGVDDSVQGN